jgi:short-subunit dehydrogenase
MASPSRWRTALVTGASSGIGRAFAWGLAGRGIAVVAVARRGDRLADLAAELQTACGVTVEVLEADLTDADQRASVEARLADRARPVDVLVNNAGFGTQGRFAELPVDREEEEIRLNVLAVVRLTHAVLPGMIERGDGGLVNVSSIAGHQPIPLWATYSATKAYVTTFSRALTAELAGTGVRVVTVMPGFTYSEFHDHSGFERALVPGKAWMTPEAVAETALRRLERGRKETVPGAHFRALAVASRLSPWPLTRRVLRVATRRMW